MLKILKYIRVRRVPPFEVQNSGGYIGKGIVSVHFGNLMIETCMGSAVRSQRKGTQIGRQASQERLSG